VGRRTPRKGGVQQGQHHASPRIIQYRNICNRRTVQCTTDALAPSHVPRGVSSAFHLSPQKFFGKTFQEYYGRKGKKGGIEVPWAQMLNFRDFVNITTVRAAALPKMDHHLANQVRCTAVTYSVVLYCTVLYCTVLYYTVLYCTVL